MVRDASLDEEEDADVDDSMGIGFLVDIKLGQYSV